MTDNTDIIKAYEFVAGRETFLPSDLADEFGHNMRYSREIIGVLLSKKLAKLDTSTDLDFYTPVLPDDPTKIREFGMKKLGLKEAEVRQPKAAKSATSYRSKPTKDLRPCLCGCGQQGHSNYRPGHDARHAGQVGREIAANYATKGFDRRTLLDALPSDALKAKAEKVAETEITKIERKNRPKIVEGTATVGKREVAARKFPTTNGENEQYEYLKDDGTWTLLSKTAVKTFVEG